LTGESDGERDARRVRATLWTIIVVAGGLAAAEAGLALLDPRAAGLWVLAVGTGAFAASLVPCLWMVRRGDLGKAVQVSCGAILCIQVLYLAIYPAAYPAITIASFVVVALSLSSVSGPGLLRIVVASGFLAAASVVWGNLARPLAYVPPRAAATILIGSGLAAVAVAMVLLWEFAQHMTRALSDAHEANDELSAAHEKLRDLDRLKGQFINTAAHELNTPMTPVLLQLSLLKTGKRGTLDEEQMQSVEVIERNVMRMNSLVREMLDVARTQAGRLAIRPEEFALRGVLLEAIHDYAAVAKARDVLVLVEPGRDLSVVADRGRVAQVLSNLLSNAVRLTPANGSITLATREEPGEVVVSVTDTGIGLSEPQLGALFQPFMRIHEELAGGTGLGLYICRGLMEGMGGRLWAQSPGPGKGAVFSFSLPAV
jgi:signal transduction histidine kinase